MDHYPAAECPRCGWPRPITTGARIVCTHCGLGRQAEPVEVPTDAAAERLRGFVRGPDSPADRAAARRFLDRLADDWWLR